MLRLLFVSIIFLAIDFYFFQGLKAIWGKKKGRNNLFTFVFWITSFLCIAGLAIVRSYTQPPNGRAISMLLTALSLIQSIYIAKLLCIPFLLLDDLRRLGTKLFRLTVAKNISTNNLLPIKENLIPRSTFLSWMGTSASLVLFGSFALGFSNKYNYQLKKIKLRFPHIPKAFDQFKIVQISDIHSGSFDDPDAVKRGINMVLNEQPDLIVFTGDLVNNRASEMNSYINIFSGLSAPFGVFSILGNHDYGDYVTWPSTEAKDENLRQLKSIHSQLGWTLLTNQNTLVSKDEQSIALLGVENWGAGNFSKYGKLDLAYRGTENNVFKILLSHDPSHWDAEVRKKYPDIALTLSGHTHGLQFGIENSWMKWSPAQWFYKQWAGLYEEGDQKLYINRGFGFVGYQGRVGIMPEITTITLHTKPQKSS